MSLYSYKKSNEISSAPSKIILETNSKKTIWNKSAEGYDELKNLTYKSKIAGVLIPSFFIFTGFYLIWLYLHSEIVTIIQEHNGALNQGNITPVNYDYINLSEYISNPEGLDKVSKEAFKQGVLQQDPISNNYSGIFYLSIPSLGMERLPVSSNVDSTTETIYNQVLKNSLAHFQNTGLPISDVKNNIVIYGHSASPSYGPRPTDPEVAFSFLRNLKVGDEIIIEIEGKSFTFKMYKSRIVEPTDFSIINGEKSRRTLTLFTCDPPGNNDSRLAIFARPV